MKWCFSWRSLYILFVSIAFCYILMKNSNLYLNRGFTVWFHLIILFYFLTEIEFLRRSLVVLGLSVTVGWYFALWNDWYEHGRFGHILYMNMPNTMMSLMVDETGHVVNTPDSVPIKIASHVLDVLAHPGITYALWRAHRRDLSSRRTVCDVITVQTVVSTWVLSRCWSILHLIHNGHGFGIFYAGYDVYNCHDLDSWFAAYIGETIVYCGYVAILIRRWKKDTTTKHRLE